MRKMMEVFACLWNCRQFVLFAEFSRVACGVQSGRAYWGGYCTLTYSCFGLSMLLPILEYSVIGDSIPRVAADTRYSRYPPNSWYPQGMIPYRQHLWLFCAGGFAFGGGRRKPGVMFVFSFRVRGFLDLTSMYRIVKTNMVLS